MEIRWDRVHDTELGKLGRTSMKVPHAGSVNLYRTYPFQITTRSHNAIWYGNRQVTNPSFDRPFEYKDSPTKKKATPPQGRLLTPENMPGGHIIYRCLNIRVIALRWIFPLNRWTFPIEAK